MPERPGNADRDELRRRAEAAAASPGGVSPEALASDEVRGTLHELRVHEIELEMQNDELRMTQAELEASGARYFDLYHLAPVGYITFDEESVIREANLAAATLLGMSYAELIGQPATSFIAPEDQDAFYRLRRRLFKDHLPRVRELRMRTADASPIWVQVAVAAAVDDAGRPACRAGLTDITALKVAQAEILGSNDRLERRVMERTATLEAANKELETFSYSASHDLRSPLRSINGYAAMLVAHLGDGLDEQGHHYLHSIITASERMGNLIDELLDYSRLGRESIRSEPVPIEPLVARLRATFDERITAAGGTLEVTEPLAVPRADPVLLERVLANLVENALTYRRPDVAARVTISAVRHRSSVTIAVADNGIGIPAEYREKIFEVFTRLHAEDAYPGTGIGLSIVRKAARLMGSDVTVESTENEGSTFSLVLPAAG